MSKATTSMNLRRSPRATPSTTNPRKRGAKQSPAPDPEPKRKCIEQKSHDGRDIDRYCWVCHKSDENSQENVCFTCPRVYHTSCLDKVSNKFSDKNVCPECQMESINGLKLSKSLTWQKLKELLLATTNMKVDNDDLKKKFPVFYSWPPSSGNSELVKIIDFSILIDKINDSVPYTKTSEFLSDLKWLQHNCIVLFGHTSKVSDAATKIIKSFKTDLLDLEACPECYHCMLCPNSLDFFVRICDPPHYIIWAKVSGYPYWPAKCLQIVNGVAHVRFFGTHDIGKVPISQCYFISKNHPNIYPRMPPKTPKYNAALKELQKYVGLYERRFGTGSFHFYEERTAFEPTIAAPTPIISVPEESVPSTSKPNIRNLPVHINLIENGMNDQPSTSAASSSDAVTVSMTFSEEQSRTLNELDSPGSFNSTPSTLDTLQSIDLRTCTETTIVQSTPVLISSSFVIDLSENDLNEGEDFLNVNDSNNETVTNSNESHNNETVTSNNESPNNETVTNNNDSPTNETVTNNNDSSSEATQTASATEVPTSPDITSVPSTSSNSSREFETIDIIEPLITCSTTTSANDVTDLNNPDASLVPLNRPQVEEGLIMSYLNNHGGRMVDINRDLRSLIYSIFVHLWTLGNNAPTATEVLTSVVKDLESCKRKLFHTQAENDRFRVFIRNHKGITDKFCKDLKNLELSLEEERRKSEHLRMEFDDATKNAKLVVNSVKRSTNSYWTEKVNKYSQKLKEKDNHIAEIEKEMDSLKNSFCELQSQKIEIENLYQETFSELAKSKNCEKLCSETQTELCQVDVFSRTDVNTMLEENKMAVERSKEKELHKDIIDAKRDLFCYVCLKPAKVHCCMVANYCSTVCQKKHAKKHAKSCHGRNEMMPHDIGVPQHTPLCPSMIKQMNQTKTVTTIEHSFHIQVEGSVQTLDPHVYTPVSTDQ